MNHQPSAARPTDVTTFYTYQHPDEYYPDWRGYYERALIARTRLQHQFPHDLGLKYGDDPRQMANLYLPQPEAPDTAPLILYFHGGRWREGHPDLYDALATPWLERGAVFASVGYRLMPDHTIADAIDDCLRAITWAHTIAPLYHADPNRLIVVGHSSGGHLAAMATLTDWAAPDAPMLRSVAATICMSAPTDLRTRNDIDADPTPLSPALRITRAPSTVVVSYGDPEPNKKTNSDTYLTEQGRQLIRALHSFGATVHPVVLKGVDHIGSATAFSDRQSPLFKQAQKAIFNNSP